MKVLAFLASAIIAVSLSTSTLAQNPPPTPPPAPQMGPTSGSPMMPSGGFARNLRVIRIGPTDSLSNAQSVSGSARLAVSVPPNTDVATVDIYLDGKLIQTLSRRPFFAPFDTATTSEGEHTFKAVGKNANGGEVWNASAKANITRDNNQGNTPGSIAQPVPSVQPSKTPGMPMKSGVHQPMPTSKPAQQTSARPSSGVNLGKTYSNETYALTIKYPDSWVVEDETSKLPKKSENKMWLVFGSSPIAKSPMVVNIRRTPLEQGSTADTFYKFNDYLQSWERKTVGDSPAFATTSGTQQSKRVVHRLIIIKNGSAWMFNCIDTSGESPAASKAIFDAMVNSFKLL